MVPVPTVFVVGSVTVMGVTTGYALGITLVPFVVVMSSGVCDITAMSVVTGMVVMCAHRSTSISASPGSPIPMGVVGVEQHAHDSWTAMSGSVCARSDVMFSPVLCCAR